MVTQTQVLPPFWGNSVVQKMKYRPKHVENGGHFEIQDGRHGDKWKKWQQFDLNSWVPSPSFKTKKSNCSRTSHKYQFRHISDQTSFLDLNNYYFVFNFMFCPPPCTLSLFYIYIFVSESDLSLFHVVHMCTSINHGFISNFALLVKFLYIIIYDFLKAYSIFHAYTSIVL